MLSLIYNFLIKLILKLYIILNIYYDDVYVDDVYVYDDVYVDKKSSIKMFNVDKL